MDRSLVTSADDDRRLRQSRATRKVPLPEPAAFKAVASTALAEAPIPTPPAVGASRPSNLPVTGGDHDAVLVAAGALVVAGVAAIVVAEASTS
jgi:LPXTG-motif cell wall-anchored protein